MLTDGYLRDHSPADSLIIVKRQHAQGSWTKMEGSIQAGNAAEPQDQEMASLTKGECKPTSMRLGLMPAEDSN